MAGGPRPGAAHQLRPQGLVGYPLQLHLYADVFPHASDGLAGLHLGGHAPDGRRQVDAETVWIAGLGQQCLGALGVEITSPVGRHQMFIAAPVPHAQGAAETSQQRVHQRLPVDSHGHGFTHFPGIVPLWGVDVGVGGNPGPVPIEIAFLVWVVDSDVKLAVEVKPRLADETHRV